MKRLWVLSACFSPRIAFFFSPHFLFLLTDSFHFDLKQAKETILAHSAILQEKEEEIQRLQKEVSHIMQLHHNSMHID